MITRSIGKIVRGRCTPFQLIAASVLGATLGFAPSFGQAPGLVLSLAAVLAILNANLFVAGLVGAGAHLLSLVLQPVCFALGRFFLDGPTSELFRKAINAPVLAYFGFERYVTSGGLALGLLLGVVVGVGLAQVQSLLRAKLASAQEGSERYQRVTSKRWVRVATLVLLGGKSKQGYDELRAKRVGNPVRLIGVVGVVAAAVLAYGANALLGSAYLQNTLRAGLERANGATVDLDALDLRLSEGRFVLGGLALADRDDLSRDVFRGRSFEADLSTRALLQKRLVIERLVVLEASSGDERVRPGQPIEPRPGTEQPEEDSEAGDATDEELTLEEVLADVELWRDRLARVRRVLAQVGQDKEDVERGADDSPASDGDESLSERLARRAAQWGYGEVVATHLFDARPRIEIGEIVIAGFRIADFPGELFELRIENLSSAPSLLEEGALVSLSSHDGDVRFAFDLGDRVHTASSTGSGSRRANLQFVLRGLPIDALTGGIVIDGQRVVEGGTLDVELDGAYLDGAVDLPLRVTLHDSTLTVPGYRPTAVQSFALPIGMRGPLDSPSFSVDDDELVGALVQAGKDELARRVREEADARLAEARAELDARLEAELGEGMEELGAALSEKLEESGLDLEGLDLGELELGDLEEGAPAVKEKAAGLLNGVLGRKN